MDDLELSTDWEQGFASVIGARHSSVTKPAILAVDDDEDNLLLLAYILEPLGCTFLSATDGLNALAIARTYQPDVILLDILMPHMDGIEVISRLRKDARTRDIPAIAVTALAVTDDRRRLLQAGFNDNISKPYMLEDIEATVRRHLCLQAAIS